MVKRVSATEARVHFGELLRSVAEHGERVVVERGGKPAAVVISYAEYDRLVGATGTDWWEMVLQTQAAFAKARERGVLPDAAEEIRAGREERDRQLDEALFGRQLGGPTAEGAVVAGDAEPVEVLARSGS